MQESSVYLSASFRFYFFFQVVFDMLYLTNQNNQRREIVDNE
jgi:hypothetical protein